MLVSVPTACYLNHIVGTSAVTFFFEARYTALEPLHYSNDRDVGVFTSLAVYLGGAGLGSSYR